MLFFHTHSLLMTKSLSFLFLFWFIHHWLIRFHRLSGNCDCLEHFQPNQTHFCRMNFHEQVGVRCSVRYRMVLEIISFRRWRDVSFCCTFCVLVLHSWNFLSLPQKGLKLASFSWVLEWNEIEVVKRWGFNLRAMSRLNHSFTSCLAISLVC